MELFRKLWNLIWHLNNTAAWQSLVDHVGHTNIYVVLFCIIFAETGLVIFPFLPGDSLLFTIGAIAAKGIGIELKIIIPVLIVAAVIGDSVNYWIGHTLGPAVFSREDSKLLNKKHLLKAQQFYDKYGTKTIIMARFVPIVRTFAPFVAGVGKMNYLRFVAFSIIGSIAWVMLCVMAGSLLGEQEFVKKHFEIVLIAVVGISILPVVIEVLRSRKQPQTDA